MNSSFSYWAVLSHKLGLIDIGHPPPYEIRDFWERVFCLMILKHPFIKINFKDFPIFLHNQSYFITKLFFYKLIQYDLITTGHEGGLVMGLSHASGGIPMIAKCGIYYQIIGEMEGYEFLVNEKSTQKRLNELIKINNYQNFPKEFTEIDPYPIPKQIDKLLVPHGNVLLCSDNSQFIINKFSTRENLKILNTINKEINPSPTKCKFFNFLRFLNND